MDTTSASTVHPHRDRLLAQHITTLIGTPQPATLAFLREHLRWVELGAGQPLMRQDEPGDAAYLLVSGRLRAYVRDDNGVDRQVREMSRGEVIGEMSMYTGRPRSATVVAVRDSVLVRLGREHFAALLATCPEISIRFTGQIIHRLQTEHQRRPVAAPVTLALMPVSAGVALDDFAAQLATQLTRFGRVRSIDAAAMDQCLGLPGAAGRDEGDVERRIALALDDLEAQHDFVLLLADAAPSTWTRRCIRHGDELLLVADATEPPAVHPIEQDCLTPDTAPSEAAEILVLLHPADAVAPRGTHAWLARRSVTDHVHLRRSREADMARLARLISRNAIGIVFGGGGARGFAHLGVWRALRDQGIEIDCVGGTSIGAVMAAVVAADAPLDRAIGVARAAFKRNPTGDYNLLPLVSLIKGRRARHAVESAVEELIGAGAAIEDLWKSYFCVASNYSQAREQRIDRGDLARALLASIAIPGALPPVVHDGDLLCDGGTFNNFPVDLMRQMRGVGRVIGVDLGTRSARRIEFDEVPGSWALLRDRLRPRSQRRYRLPSLTSYLLNITIMYSISRQGQSRALTDLYFNPPLHKVGLLQWSRFEDILRQGERHAREVLGALTDEQRRRLGLSG